MRLLLSLLFVLGIFTPNNAQITSVTYKTGIADSNGKILIPMSNDTAFTFIDPNNSKMLRIFVGDKVGVIDIDGRSIIPLEYESIYNFFYDRTLAKKNGKWGIIDKQGNVIQPFEFENIRFHSKELAFASLNGKYGTIDTKGDIKTPFIYDKIIVEDTFLYSLAPHFPQYAVFKDYRAGAIDSTGRLIVPCKYDNIGTYDGLYTSVEDDGKWGYVDTLGNIAVPFVFDKVYPFVNDIAVVGIDDKYGLIDRKGKLVTPCKYKYIDDNQHGCMEAYNDTDDEYILINKKGKEIRPRFKEINNYKNGLYAVHKAEVLDENGNELYAIVNAQGKMVQPFQYTDVSNNFEDGVLILKKNNLYGGINTEGKEVIPFIYNETWDNQFTHEVLRVVREDKVGLIDTSGRELLPCRFDDIDFANYSKITFTEEEVYGVFDTEQKKILFTSSEYERIRVNYDNIISAQKDNKWALISADNRILTPFIFDYLAYVYNENFIEVVQEQKRGLVDSTGRSILPCIYDQIEVSKDGEIIIVKNVKERKEIR
ncbi:WG repeat-containing protein [Dysgonomonas macrotermitis]|uniref:WG containing repeat-containing protein n=1 Tax=Dysgonomonas macrotermitis TaxID=1346286 RepID=A0A1M4SYY8_9BACT|nr:WG repeat-containing protein [Dysgonomonas macrotermitis]SHE37401.1 WG containing repeat-containing protein [Dysgonomonas macrotermitis]